MSNIIRKTVATVAASLAVAGLGATTTHAAEQGLPKSDRAAVKQANKECQPVTDDVSFEFCVLGAFSQITGKIYGGEDYEINSKGNVTVTRTQTPVKVKATKATKRDQKHLKLAVKQADYGVAPELDAQYMYVIVGTFIAERGRYISDSWVTFGENGDRPRLTRHSVRVTDTVPRDE